MPKKDNLPPKKAGNLSSSSFHGSSQTSTSKKSSQSSSTQPNPTTSTNSSGGGSSSGKDQTSISSYFSLSEADIERKVGDVVQFLLISDQNKIPIRKSDITNHVIPQHKKHFNVIMKKAEEMLLSVFGCELIELDGKMKGRYILVTEKSEGFVNNPFMMCTEEDSMKLGLLFNILAVIYMSGGVISDKEFWKTLGRLGVRQDHRHEAFGDIKKLIDLFIKQGYLDHEKHSQKTDPPSYQFHWGQRALLEVEKKDVLTYVSKIYDKHPTEWKLLWQECNRDEQDEQEVID